MATNSLSPRTNPLDLPEIVSRVVSFLPSCDEDTDAHVSLIFILRPQELQACLLVSKTWHKTLLPFIWQAYDGRAMKDIPNEIISLHSRRFRRILPSDQRRLVRDNPGLKLLHWSGGSSFPRLDADDFSNLRNLKALQLICWDAPDMRLFDVLKLVSGSLTSFGCRFLTGVRPEDLSPPKVDHDVDSEAEERLSFPSLADVAANFFDVARAAFEGRAYRPYVIGIQEQGDLLWNCPQLETLSLTLPTNTNIYRLTDVLRDRCPTLRYFSVGYDDGNEAQLAYLVGYCSRSGLHSLDLKRKRFESNMVTAIDTHASTLERLHGTAYLQPEGTDILLVLVSGRKLRHVHLVNYRMTADQFSSAITLSQA
ncbi:hypothetical protein BGX23_011778 [Mortierella sp. AD031]|nr:hypothetical protein BGX23_011778 [Mortierella sp. AD031]